MSVELIAECSTNHGGSMDLAKEFIQRFADAGADFVKFQLTRVEHLRKDDPQLEWFAKVELTEDQFAELKAATEAAGSKFLLTVYHAAEVPILTRLGMNVVKIGSGEARERSLWTAIHHAHIARVIVSGGLLSMTDTLTFNADQLVCVTRYPAPHGLAAALLTQQRTQNAVGWSDHAVGLDECYAAICCGARIIEKHVHLIGQARQVQPWEASTGDFKRLRKFADDNPMERFLGRWQA